MSATGEDHAESGAQASRGFYTALGAGLEDLSLPHAPFTSQTDMSTAAGEGTGEASPGKGEKRRRGRAAKKDDPKTPQAPPRWVRPLYAPHPQDPNRLRLTDDGKITCRLCAATLTFANSSYNSAHRHARSHGLDVSDEAALVALGKLCGEFEEKGGFIPEDAWKKWKVSVGKSKVKEEPSSAPKPGTLSTYFRLPCYAPTSEQARRIKRAMARWIASDGIQLRVVETEAFRDFTKVLDGKCPEVGRKAITNQIHTFYEDAVRRLAADGKWGSYRPAFTCDMWHGPGPKEYLTVTAHWIEPTEQAFVLRMRVLGSLVVPEVHMDHVGKCLAVSSFTCIPAAFFSMEFIFSVKL